MIYPIFNSIVNTVKTQLTKRGIQARKFKTWEDNKIHATGLELVVDLAKSSGFIDALSINFDWDSFREATVARKLQGMEQHPLLKIERMNETDAPAALDVELTWMFNEELCQPQQDDKEGNYRIEQASRWMEAISKEINLLLKNENLITRWHIEIEGDEHGRFLSSINLISYFQYEVNNSSNLNELQSFVSRQLHDLLLKANKVISSCDDILSESLAA